MKNLAKTILKDLEKLSFDNMDEFDKYDYFKNNILRNVEWLCKQTLNDKPMIVSELSGNCNSLTTLILEDSLFEQYNTSEVIMGEMLASIGVNNISLEKAVELYTSLMNQAEGDVFIQIQNESISEEDLDELGEYKKL